MIQIHGIPENQKFPMYDPLTRNPVQFLKQHLL